MAPRLTNNALARQVMKNTPVPHEDESDDEANPGEVPAQDDDLIRVEDHNLAHSLWFQEDMIDKEGYTEKEWERGTGIITNMEGKSLFASNFKTIFSYKGARCEMQRPDGIFQIVPMARLLRFMENFNATWNTEFTGPLLDEHSQEFQIVRNSVDVALDPAVIGEQDLVSNFDFILITAAANARRPGGSFVLSKDSQIAYLSHGVIARPSSEGPEILDINSGILGRCDRVFKHADKPFAALEAKIVIVDRTLRWHRQGKNLCLQLYNSFIGSEAEVGIALVLGGFHIVWREQTEDGISMRSKVGEVKTFNFYRLSMQFSEIRSEYDIVFYTKVFVHLARICCDFKESRKINVGSPVNQEIMKPQENLNQ
jgi:hypothetical protein